MADKEKYSTEIFLICGGITLFAWALKNFLRSRKVEDTSTIPIKSAPQGLVELEGYAYPVQETKKTLDGKSCVFLELELQKEIKNGWSTVWENKNNTIFGIVDPSGIACIDPKQATTEIKMKIFMWKQLDSKLQSEFTNLIDKNISGFPPTGFFSNTYRVTQKAIYVGNPIYVMGSFRTSSDQKAFDLGPNFYDFVRKVQNQMKALKFAETTLTSLTDKHKAVLLRDKLEKNRIIEVPGLTNQQEQVTYSKDSEFDVVVSGFVENSEIHKLFFADCHERELLKRIGKWNIPMMIIGLGLMVLGTFMLFNKKY